MSEPQQGLSYEEILALARTAEEAGFESFLRSDHYTSFPGDAYLRTTDAWTTLAGLARETSRITLGTLVSPVTFRIPGSFIKVAMTVDEMSGGRVEVGIGAGWNEGEHQAHGIPYPSDRERVDMFEEELQIFSGLWDKPDGWGFQGRHWQVTDAHLRPRDRAAYATRGDGRSRPNLIVGGSGRPRTLRIAARYADEYNMSSSTPEACRDAFEHLDALCREEGRDPAAITRSVMVGVLVGRDEAEVRDRTARLFRAMGEFGDPEAWMAQRSDRWLIGTAHEARERLKPFVDAGAQRVMLQDFIPWDLEHVKVIADVFLR